MIGQDPEAIGRFVEQCAAAFQGDPLLRPHADAAFERLERIGVGGMGAVYRVRDHRAGREAALKLLLPPQRAEPAVAERKARRFIREARVTALLDHPAIPTVYEYGRSCSGELFILMKLIRGQTLAHRIQELHRKGRPARGVYALTRVLARVCDALGYAHEQGVIHRDVKPDNIMIGGHGEVYLMDWGLARDRRDPEDEELLRSTTDLSPSVFDDQASVKGGLVGTFGYMAPEQAMGKELGPAVDLFAIGAILYQILCGEPPVVGDGFVGVAAVLDGRIDFSRRRLAASPELIALTRACLEAEPKKRPADADELAERLRIAAQPRRIPRLRPELILALGLLVAGLAAWLALSLSGESRRRAEDLAARDRDIAALTSRVEGDEHLARELAERAAAKAGARPKPPPLSPERKAELMRLLKAGNLAYKAKDYEESLSHYRACLAIMGEDGRVRGFIARVYLRQKRYREAYEAAGEALELGARDAFTYFQHSSAASKLGYREEALEDLDRAIELDPKYFNAILGRANILLAKGLRREALRDFDRLVDLDEDPAMIFSLRGEVRCLLGEFREGLADFDRARAAGPLNPIARAYYGSALAAVGRFEEAREELARALEENPPGPLRSRIRTWQAQIPKR